MREVVVYTLLFSAMLQLFMAFYAWGYRNEAAAKPLIMVFLLGAIWALSYGMDMMTGDLQVKLFWTKIYWTAASLGPFSFLLIVLEHLEIRHRLKRWHQALLLMPSFVLIALVWSMPYHALLMYDFRVESIGGLDILHKESGPLYAPIFLVLQGISIYSYFVLGRSIATASRMKRRQSITILIALLIPFVVNIPTIMNAPIIRGFDFTPHALVVSSGMFAFAILRYRWLDILPLARAALVETIPFGVIVLDAKNRIADVNPMAKDLLQFDDSVIGQDASTAFARYDPILRTPPGGGTILKEIMVARGRGEARHIDVQMIPLQNQEGGFNGRMLTLQDITERKLASEQLQAQLHEIESLHAQLRDQAIHDHLTGLFNRWHMGEALDRELQRAERHQRPLSLLMLEVDDFKLFNDSYGHDAGDFTLQQVTGLIQANTRAEDIACRFGGDEFILVLPETPLDAARQCAERIRGQAAALDLVYEGKLLKHLTVSIGVAVFPRDGNSSKLLLRATDRAMYRAKQAGKNRVETTDG